MTNKDYNSAIQNFTDILKIDEHNEEARFYRAVSCLDSGLM